MIPSPFCDKFCNVPKCNVEASHVVSHIAVEVDQHVSGFTDNFRNLLNRIAIATNHTRKYC